MSQFEYLSVMISIVIALGLSEVASAWGRLLRNRARVRFHWLHAFWSVFTVVLMIQFWWGFWEFRVVESWTFLGLLAVVVECLVLVVAAMVLVPSGEIADSIDLRVYFLEQSRVFFILGVLLMVELIVIDALVGGQRFLDRENAFRLPGVALAGVAAATRGERFHAALALVAAALLIGFLAFDIVA